MNILNRFFNWVYGGYSVGEMAEVNERKKGLEKPKKDQGFKGYGKRYVNKYYGLAGCYTELTDMQGISIGYSGGHATTYIKLSAIDDRGFIAISKEEYIKLGGEI